MRRDHEPNRRVFWACLTLCVLPLSAAQNAPNVAAAAAQPIPEIEQLKQILADQQRQINELKQALMQQAKEMQQMKDHAGDLAAAGSAFPNAGQVASPSPVLPGPS